jgi:hypothetical protein
MISHSIVTFKEHIPAPVVHRQPQPAKNRSNILTQQSLEAFLETQPKAGEYVYYTPPHNPNTPLKSPHQLFYVSWVCVDFSLLQFSWLNGWPETHQILSCTSGYDSKPYLRYVDIREYKKITDAQHKEFVSDFVQDYVKKSLEKRMQSA